MPAEGRGLRSGPGTRRRPMAGRLAMSLAPPPKVRKLQDALHSKAQDAPGYRFYALYDELYREDILRFAYDRCQANGGAPGVDGQDFEDIESQGLDAWLGALTTELREETYQPQAVRRVNIPKDDQPGEFRPLGIPCIKIAWYSWRRCWCWSRSSRRTSSPSRTRIAPSPAPWTPSGRSRHCCERAIPKGSTRICPATPTVSPTPIS